LVSCPPVLLLRAYKTDPDPLVLFLHHLFLTIGVSNVKEMKKLLSVTVLVFCCFHTYGQKIEVSEGINTTFFYDFPNNYSRDPDEIYNHRLGQNVGMCISDIGPDNFRIGLKLANYKGIYDLYFRSQGAETNRHLNLNKYIIEIEVFVVNLKLLTNLRINIGGEFSCLLYDATTGFYSSWHMPTSHDDTNTSSRQVFEAGTWDGNVRISAGIISRIAYEFALPGGWFFIPQTSFYVGLTNEFKTGLPRTMRPYLEI
jgi:hypothetical protein